MDCEVGIWNENAKIDAEFWFRFWVAEQWTLSDARCVIWTFEANSIYIFGWIKDEGFDIPELGNSVSGNQFIPRKKLLLNLGVCMNSITSLCQSEYLQ